MQVIPHITNEIKTFIHSVGERSGADVVITEIGGTIGDIESQPFIEAIRQVSMDVGRDNCCFIHVTLVPYISGSCEFKSKPTQHSVKELQGMGICPDIIVTRSDLPLPGDIKNKMRAKTSRRSSAASSDLIRESRICASGTRCWKGREPPKAG